MEPTTYARYRACQVADRGRLPADGTRALASHEGNHVMSKVLFSAALAVALITAPWKEAKPEAKLKRMPPGRNIGATATSA
jgi:hypothetical protein